VLAKASPGLAVLAQASPGLVDIACASPAHVLLAQVQKQLEVQLLGKPGVEQLEL